MKPHQHFAHCLALSLKMLFFVPAHPAFEGTAPVVEGHRIVKDDVSYIAHQTTNSCSRCIFQFSPITWQWIISKLYKIFETPHSSLLTGAVHSNKLSCDRHHAFKSAFALHTHIKLTCSYCALAYNDCLYFQTKYSAFMFQYHKIMSRSQFWSSFLHFA